MNFVRECFEEEFPSFSNQIKTLNEDMDNEMLNSFLSGLAIYNVKNDKIVCDYGDFGREFYVILEGKVDILIMDEQDFLLSPVSEKHEKEKKIQKGIHMNKAQMLLQKNEGEGSGEK